MPATETGDVEAHGVPPMGAPQLAGRVVLDPSVPFAVRTTEGEPLAIRTGGGGGREAGAFRAADPALAGYLIVDFDAFDAWYEEDERNVGHPRATCAASAVAYRLAEAAGAGGTSSAALAAQAAVHGYTTAFW